MRYDSCPGYPKKKGSWVIQIDRNECSIRRRGWTYMYYLWKIYSGMTYNYLFARQAEGCYPQGLIRWEVKK